MEGGERCSWGRNWYKGNFSHCRINISSIWLSFHFSKLESLLGINSTRVFISCPENAAYSSSMATSSSATFSNCHPLQQTRLATISHSFAIGFMSEILPGQIRTLISFYWNQPFGVVDAWRATLFCSNIRLPSYIGFSTVSIVSMYLSEFISVCSHEIFDLPLAQHSAQIITLTPPVPTDLNYFSLEIVSITLEPVWSVQLFFFLYLKITLLHSEV